jgi:subtilisin family serine protease
MKLVLKKTIQIFFVSTFILIVVIFAFNNIFSVLANENTNTNQELIIRLKTGQLLLLKFDESADLDKIKNTYKKYEEINTVGKNNKYTISALPNDPDLVLQTYLKQIKADMAWTWAREAEDIIIAIIDTGVQLDHPDLKGNFWINKDEIQNNEIDDDLNGYVDDIYGWDFVNNTTDNNVKISLNYQRYAVNHGTVIAGIAAAIANNNQGIAGITWKTKIMSLRAIDSQGQGNTYNIARAIDYATKNGADIINLSFVGNKKDPILESAIQRAYRAGIPIVAAAGNEINFGVDLDKNIKYPICYDFDKNMILGVGSVDANNKISSFSNFGENCIDIMAPGENFYSTQVYKPELSDFKNPYGNSWSGTSFATPLLSGTIALIKKIDPNFTIEEIYMLIKENATNISFINFSKRDKIGAGLLNIDQTLIAARRLKKTRSMSLVTIPTKGINPDINFFDQKNNEIDTKKIINDYYNYDYKISSGDLNDDNKNEIVISKTNWLGTEISIYDENLNLINSFHVDFNAPIDLEVGDIYNNKREKIIIGSPVNTEPRVYIYDSKGKLLNNFLAYDEKFRGGVSVAIGDVDGDYRNEIITAPASSGGPHIRIFDKNGGLKGQFFAGNKNFRGGLNIKAGNLNKNKGAEILIAPKDGSSPYVLIYDLNGNLISNFMAYNENFKKEVSIEIADINSDYQNEIITSAGAGGGPHVRIFDLRGNLIKQFFAYNQYDLNGVYITPLIKNE